MPLVSFPCRPVKLMTNLKLNGNKNAESVWTYIFINCKDKAYVTNDPSESHVKREMGRPGKQRSELLEWILRNDKYYKKM